MLDIPKHTVTHSDTDSSAVVQLCMGQVSSPCVKGRKQEVTLQETESEQRVEAKEMMKPSRGLREKNKL